MASWRERLTRWWKSSTIRRLSGPTWKPTEIALSEANRAMAGTACDAEIVEVEIDGRPMWSLAFAAFGPLEVHVGLVTRTWSHLIASGEAPPELRLRTAMSCDYPELLARLAGRAEAMAAVEA